MCEILIFGGTTEGRLLGEFCEAQKIPAWLSVVSDYGRDVLGEMKFLQVVQGAMECAQMKEFFALHGIRLVIDATHPYARNASENIKAACLEAQVRLVRCLRGGAETNHNRELPEGMPGSAKQSGCEDKREEGGDERVYLVPDIETAAAFLETVSGAVLVTTGSRELSVFTKIADYRERIYARVLPSSAVMRQCEQLGIAGKHLIGMQGPFSREMNEALIRQSKASWLVTKESGEAGGYQEKLDAAKACGIGAVVIQRPTESGLPFEAVCRILEAEAAERSETAERSEAFELLLRSGPSRAEAGLRGLPKSGCLTLAGIGTGSAGQMTAEVREAICDSDALVGAGRMLEAAKAVLEQEAAGAKLGQSAAGAKLEQAAGKGKKSRPVMIQSYREQEILSLIRLHPEWEKITVLYSGDTGFYSGAAGLAGVLRQEAIPFRILPGLSSVSCFAAKLMTSWEDAAIYTAHGRTLDIGALMEKKEPKILILMGGEDGAGVFLRDLRDAGFGSLAAAVGENLSYPNERIRRGAVDELARETFDSLSLIMIEKKPGE